MTYSIAAAEECHLPDLYLALDTIAREQSFLAMIQAPPWEESLAFYTTRHKQAARRVDIQYPLRVCMPCTQTLATLTPAIDAAGAG